VIDADDMHPPELRLKAAGLALSFCHAKKAEEQSGEQVNQITELRTIIVSPPDRTEAERAHINESFASAGLPYRVDENGATVRRDALTEPAESRTGPLSKPEEGDPVAAARSRLDRMRGVN
jgi:hypothetical protein